MSGPLFWFPAPGNRSRAITESWYQHTRMPTGQRSEMDSVEIAAFLDTQ
jgi:hypothetical protein